MKTEFVRFVTQDAVELQGLYFSPDNTKPTHAVVHVHGLAGNFYENRFVDRLAEVLTEEGYGFLVFNNRGHDYLSDLLQLKEGEWISINGGGAFELFEQSLLDIDAALALVQERGVRHFCLQGHSSGANKVVYFQQNRQRQNVGCLVLLSPCDDIGIQMDALGDRFAQVLATAQALVNAGDGDKLMPQGTFFSYPISASTYLDYFGPTSQRDTFPYRDPEAGFDRVRQLRCPLLVLFGNNGEYVLGDLNQTLALLQAKATASPRVDAEIIDGAPHNYLGKEAELCTTIMNWLRRVMPVA